MKKKAKKKNAKKLNEDSKDFAEIFQKNLVPGFKKILKKNKSGIPK
jgi:hypothetical protein